MKKIWLYIIISCMLSGFAFGEVQLLAFNSTEDQIYQQEKTQFENWKAEAEKGDLNASFNLGIAYLYGRGTKLNLAEGNRLVRDAADRGNPSAQNWLGDFYADFYSEEDLAMALEWWNKAAAQGEPHAQYSIGKCYEQGLGVAQNHKTAVSYYSLSAEQGVSDAGIALTNCYLEGKGVKKDVKEAYFWMLVNFPDSWDNGYESIDNIAALLKAKDIKKVRTRAQKWLDTHK